MIYEAEKIGAEGGTPCKEFLVHEKRGAGVKFKCVQKVKMNSYLWGTRAFILWSKRTGNQNWGSEEQTFYCNPHIGWAINHRIGMVRIYDSVARGGNTT